MFLRKASVKVELSIDETMEKVLKLAHETETDIDTDFLFGILEDQISDYFMGQFEEADNCTKDEDFWKRDALRHFGLSRLF
jgi:hypothetical protein